MPPSLPASGVTARTSTLESKITAYLDSHPTGRFTPAAIGDAIGHSSGAVLQAAQRLEARGEIRLVDTKPRRYASKLSSYPAVPAPPPTPRPPSPTPPAAPAAAPASSSPAPPPASGPAGSGPLIRPNGQRYYARKLANTNDVKALRKLREARIPAMLYGPPGTGKTSLVEAAFPDVITVAGDGDTAVADLIGEYTQAPDGTYEFVYGPLIQAMTEGRVLFLDDATLVSPKVLAVVYPAMDGRREIIVKGHKGERIKAADGFYVVAGHNPGVHGAVLTEALSSRFSVQIRVSTDFDLAPTLDIPEKAVNVARNLATRQEAGEIGWAPQLRELLAFRDISKVLGQDAAIANLLSIAPEDDRDIVANAIRLVFGRTVSPLALGPQE